MAGGMTGGMTGGDVPVLPPTDLPTSAPPSGGHEFGSTAPEDFPVGSWTVNKLIASFGAPDSVEGYYIETSDLIMVFLQYSNASVNFFPMDAYKFASYNDSIGDMVYFPIDEKDWTIEMDLIGVSITGPGIALPHGIEIGSSTIDQIKEAYGEDPDYEWSDKELYCAQYDFPSSNQGGLISYYFEASKELTSAMVMYF
jgi:hypothetical protein